MLLHSSLLAGRGVWFYHLFPDWVIRAACREKDAALALYCFCRRVAFYLVLGEEGEVAWEFTRTCLFSVAEWFFSSAYIDRGEWQQYCKEILCIQILNGRLVGREDPFKLECVMSWSTSPASEGAGWKEGEEIEEEEGNGPSPPTPTSTLLPRPGACAEEKLMRSYPLFNRCVRCEEGKEEACMVEGEECSSAELRHRCEPRAGVHLCNKHACQILLPRTVKHREKHFTLRDGRVVRQLGWLKQHRLEDLSPYRFGVPPVVVHMSSLLEEQVEKAGEGELEHMCRYSLGISPKMLKPTHRIHAFWRGRAAVVGREKGLDSFLRREWKNFLEGFNQRYNHSPGES